MNQPCDSTVEIDAHPRANKKAEVLRFLVHACGGCKVCGRICGVNTDNLSDFLARIHGNDP
jgi:MinD superfamily P-loop ATPase